MPRPPYAQPELRGAIETLPQRFFDGDVDVIRVTYAYPYNSGAGTLVWVGDEAFCRAHLARYRADNVRVQRGDGALISGADTTDAVDFLYGYDRWKDAEVRRVPTTAPPPPGAATPLSTDPAGKSKPTVHSTWIQTPSIDQFVAALPADRDYAGVTAKIKMTCTLTATASVQNCSVIEARPRGMQIEKAALATAGEFRLGLETGTPDQVAGQPVEVRFSVEITEEVQDRVRNDGTQRR